MKDWNVSAVTDMDYAFHIGNPSTGTSRWDTSSVTSMREMFSGARDFTGGSKKGLGTLGHVQRGRHGDRCLASLELQRKGVGSWNVGKVKDMSFMFKDACRFAEDLSEWRPSTCKTTYGMFQNAVEYESDVKDWGLSESTDTKEMFLGAANS